MLEKHITQRLLVSFFLCFYFNFSFFVWFYFNFSVFLSLSSKCHFLFPATFVYELLLGVKLKNANPNSTVSSVLTLIQKCHAIVLKAHYSKTTIVSKLSLGPKAHLSSQKQTHCCKSPFLQKYTLSFQFLAR